MLQASRRLSRELAMMSIWLRACASPVRVGTWRTGGIYFEVSFHPRLPVNSL